MSGQLTPRGPLTERDRIRNLIDQFAAGYHTADEMPGLILATLDAERDPEPAPALDAARGPDDVLREAGYQCPLCGAPHMPAMHHTSDDLRAWERARAAAPATRFADDGSGFVPVTTAERIAWEDGYATAAKSNPLGIPAPALDVEERP